MTAPKKSSKPAAKAPKTTPKRKKSKLTLAGEAAQRGMLLAALKAHGWNLSHVAADLEMGDASAVLRSVRLLGLLDEYEAARAAGKVRPGRPSDA